MSPERLLIPSPSPPIVEEKGDLFFGAFLPRGVARRLAVPRAIIFRAYGADWLALARGTALKRRC